MAYAIGKKMRLISHGIELIKTSESFPIHCRTLSEEAIDVKLLGTLDLLAIDLNEPIIKGNFA